MAAEKSSHNAEQSSTRLVALRMPNELDARVKEHQEALKRSAGGAEVPFSFAVFHLVQAGLDAQYGAGGNS